MHMTHLYLDLGLPGTSTPVPRTRNRICQTDEQVNTANISSKYIADCSPSAMVANVNPEQEQVPIQEDHEPQVEVQAQWVDVERPPARRVVQGDPQVVSVSDDCLERPPHPEFYVHAPPFHPYQQHAMAMAEYYEARMRDHAAAYASAAAGAAWAAAQIAVSAQMPPTLPPPIVYPPIYPPQHQNAAAASYPNYRPRGPHNSEFAPEERPIKRHHRMSQGSNTASNEQQERRGRRRQRVDFSSSSDGGRFNLKSQRHNSNNYSNTNTNNTQHCKKRREKLNLVGKTGVSALHEWCVHCKKMPPNFVLLPGRANFFCFAAHVDDLEWSRGRGATKASAKQDAARKALQALVPGVVFDDSGLVMDISANEAIEDLPHLAERLAIDATKKRRCDVYPGTSTTTDDDGEDENAYYANRGASVCSALLHAMWQINDDIPEPPSYSYDVPSIGTNSTKDGSRPSSFSCTATLCLRVREVTKKSGLAVKADEDELDSKPKAKRKGCVDVETSALPLSGKDAARQHSSSAASTIQMKKVLTGIGIGATKREARHVASAKLLSLLFPQCEGMVEVKACAEAAREQYAASKALKQQQIRRHGGPATTESSPKQGQEQLLCTQTDGGSLVVVRHGYHWLAKPSDPSVPPPVMHMVRSLTEHGVSACIVVDEDEVSVEALSLSETIPTVSNSASSCSPREAEAKCEREARTLSRQQQLGRMVDNALQTLNEFDEVGRSLPHAPDYDDVGRTVLRRAEVGDARFVHKLLLKREKRATTDLSRMQAILSGGPSSLVWGPASVMLLLCRAIASYDEPPLGCAILTFGFTILKGRVLRVAEIESERHLPRERFIECLEQFAANMKCQLDIEQSQVNEGSVGMQTFTKPQLKTIVESYLKRNDSLRDESGSKLQSVKEEEPDAEDDFKEPGRLKLATESVKDKPSKRSRID